MRADGYPTRSLSHLTLLSILYLRCGHVVGEPRHYVSEEAFNSLFEMLMNHYRKDPDVQSVLAFNSLFEMHV